MKPLPLARLPTLAAISSQSMVSSGASPTARAPIPLLSFLLHLVPRVSPWSNASLTRVQTITARPSLSSPIAQLTAAAHVAPFGLSMTVPRLTATTLAPPLVATNALPNRSALIVLVTTKSPQPLTVRASVCASPPMVTLLVAASHRTIGSPLPAPLPRSARM